MKILKSKKLEKNVTDIQLEMIMTRCLLKNDQQEYFKELSTEQKTSNTRDDRAAFVQVGRVEHVRLLHETCSYENSSDNEGISDKNGSTESENEFLTATESERENKKVKELTESDSGEQNTSDSEEENTKEKKGIKAPTKKVKGKKRKI